MTGNNNLCFQHEKGSCLLLDYLISDNNLENEFLQHGLKLPEDVTFIKEMIFGPLSQNDASADNGNRVS